MFLINSPFFANTRIGAGDRPLTIETEGFVEPERGGPVQYVQSVTLDGADLVQSWLSASVLQRGGRLVIELVRRHRAGEPLTGPRPSRPTKTKDPV